MSSKLDAVRHLIACWERRDIDAVLACLSDDIEYYWDMGSRPIRSKQNMAPPAQASTASGDD